MGGLVVKHDGEAWNGSVVPLEFLLTLSLALLAGGVTRVAFRFLLRFKGDFSLGVFNLLRLESDRLQTQGLLALSFRDPLALGLGGAFSGLTRETLGLFGLTLGLTLRNALFPRLMNRPALGLSRLNRRIVFLWARLEFGDQGLAGAGGFGLAILKL